MDSIEYEIMYRQEEGHWWYRGLHDLFQILLKRHLSASPTVKILDAGCGTGGLTQALGLWGQVTGIDLALEAVRFSKNRGIKSLIHGSVMKLPFKDQTFDAVISSSVLYHQWVDPQLAAWKEHARVLKSGGLFFVHLPAFSSLTSEHDRRVLTGRRYQKSEVVSLIRESGFHLVHINYWNVIFFPLVWMVRKWRWNALGRDFDHNPLKRSWRDECLEACLKIESRLIHLIPFPVGVSLVAIAEKK